MGRKIIIRSISTEALDYLVKKYDVVPENIQSLQNKSVTVSDDIVKMLDEAKEFGAIEYDDEKDNKSQEEFVGQAEDGQKKEIQTEAQIPEEQQTEEQKPEQPKQQAIEEQKQPEQQLGKKFVGDNRSKLENIILMLERNPEFVNLDEASRKAIKDAYLKTLESNADVDDPKFVEKYLREKGQSAIAQNPVLIAKANAIHEAVLSGAEAKSKMTEEQAKEENPLGIQELNDRSQEVADGMTICFPGFADKMSPYIKHEAEQDLAKKVKEYLQNTAQNSNGIKSLIAIRDLKEYVTKVKNDYQNDFSSDSKENAKKACISSMPIKEMAAVMAVMKEMTGTLNIQLQDIDWSNEVESGVAMLLLAQTQEQAREFSAEEKIVDNITVKFEINDEKDISELSQECAALKKASTQFGIDVGAELVVSPAVGNTAEVAMQAAEILAKNEIKTEGVETRPTVPDDREEFVDRVSEMAVRTPEDVMKDLGEIALPGIERKIDPNPNS